ncbi:MAG: N-ethylammeline chlorohydrolase [Thermoproteota archaeon]|nr:MAG: N-ethylammeline chlorohydrolase [Candidatus Korarchaeota archaeon]
MPDILIRRGIVVPMTERRILKEASIAIREGRIAAVGPDSVVRREYPSDIEIDAADHIVIPGLINTHTHLAMTLFRGVMDGVSGMEWLNRAWSIESNLTREDVYWGSLLGCLEMIKGGTTCFADHYFFMDAVVDAVKESCIRAALAQAIIEEGGPRGIDTTLEGSLNFAKQYDGEAKGRITCMLGPHSAYTCSPNLLKEVRRLSEETGLRAHIHLSEGMSELRIVKEKYETTPIRLLNRIGLLNPKLLAAHVVFADEEEIELLKEKDVKVNHNPICKMKGGHGASPVAKMLKKGINVSLGTDGVGSNNNLDLLEEMKFAALLQPLVERDPKAISAWDVLEMATINGARALGIEKDVGSIEVGKKADLVIIRRKVPHMVPLHNIPSLLVYSANGNDVDTVIVDGKIVMSKRKVLTIDEEVVMKRAQRVFEKLLERSGWEPIMEGIPEKI